MFVALVFAAVVAAGSGCCGVAIVVAPSQEHVALTVAEICQSLR